MKLSEYFSEPDSKSAATLAKELGVSPVLVSQWRTSARAVPIDRCVAIWRATAGKVTRRDLRPDDWEEIWPELAEAKVG